jgi:hypothetical protein
VKAKVLRRFKDKYSGKFHEPGETIVVSKERYAEILKVAPLVEAINEPKKKSAAE